MSGMREKIPSLRDRAQTGQPTIDATDQGSKLTRVRLRMLPATSATSLEQAMASEVKSDAASLFCENAILALPDALRMRLDQCTGLGRVPGQLVTALWDCLQDDTQAQASAWELIPAETGSCTPAVSTAIGAPGRKLVSARFVDIGLVARTAIVDPVRAEDGRNTYFLHANQLTLGCGVDFIAAQKPHRAEIGGFLQMLAAKGVALVVDLTAASEREADACYAPAMARSICIDNADVTVTCVSRRRLPALRSSIKFLAIRRATAAQDDPPIHALQRLHFAGWPDHGVIQSRTLRLLADQLEILQGTSSGPIVVHCMAGVGRSGTLISYIATRRRLRENVCVGAGSCSARTVAATLMETIVQGRRDRGAGFVQTREQFALVLTALIDEFAGSAGDFEAALSTAGWRPGAVVAYLDCLTDQIGDVVRQAAGRLMAGVAGIRQGRDTSAGGLVLRAETSVGGTGAVKEETGAASVGMQTDGAATTLQHAVAVTDVRGFFPPVSVTPADIVPAAATAAPGTPHLAEAAQRSQSGTPAATDARRVIAADKLLSTCYDEAVARLGQARNAAQVEELLAEIMEHAQRKCGLGCTFSDTDREILKAAILWRFARREQGIIFQAHMVRNGDVGTVPAAARRSTSEDTRIGSATLTGH